MLDNTVLKHKISDFFIKKHIFEHKIRNIYVCFLKPDKKTPTGYLTTK